MTFKALKIYKEGGAKIEVCSLDDLPKSNVLLQVYYSSINYKDALAATGKGKILRVFPLSGGIDVAGVVIESKDARFKPGDAVFATGYGLSQTHDGGYSQYQRVPADWLLHLPENLSLFESMAIGTAGFTAALAIQRMLDNFQSPDKGPVIVTGASGGVGSFAVDCLSTLGFDVFAVSSKPEVFDYLKSLGAKVILNRHELQMGERPLEKNEWGGAVDTLGGALLSWLTRTVVPHGNIAVCGLAGGVGINTTVMPFILRGINLLGIDSATCPMAYREVVWQRLASDMKPQHMDKIVVQTIGLENMMPVFERMLSGKTHGRYVVSLIDH